MTAATTAVEVSTRSTRPRFRRDVQGLRAVAVLLVLAYHAGVPFVPGGYVGVDVFFVISGFLITGLIVREVEQTGRLSLRHFYARRVKRLLPATAVVFVAVAALTVLALPVTRWREIAGDVAASAGYLVNWRLADRSVDYLAEGSAASPVQHFWSLAVEEQFYIVWPLLIVALLSSGRGRPVRRLLWGLLAITVPSFLWSIHLTAANPGAAYFVTTTRLWEMAVGALLAVAVSRVGQPSPVARRAVGWAGLGAVAYAAVAFDATTAFPGAAALVPTLGAAAVLLAGSWDGEGEVRALTPRPMQQVGALSYSLYLWHWPLVVVATAQWAGQGGTLPVPTALAVVTASALPAWLTYRLVEQPFHRSRRLAVPWRAAVAGTACVAVRPAPPGVLAVAATRVSMPSVQDAPGAAVLNPDTAVASEPTIRVTELTPSPIDAPDDVADVYADGCHQNAASPAVASCVYGDASSDVVVALVGDSHAAHWQPALALLAEEHGWRLETYTKSGCLFGDATVWLDRDSQPYTSCSEWQAQVVEDLRTTQPDVTVVSSSGRYLLVEDDEPLSREESHEPLATAMAANWTALEDAGTEVLAIVDTPWLGIDAPECVAENLDDVRACGVPRHEAMDQSGADLMATAAQRTPDADVIDLTEFICPGETCVPVVGGVLTHSDAHHLTATYARTLAPRLEGSLTSVLR